jgi:hypothetical protein
VCIVLTFTETRPQIAAKTVKRKGTSVYVDGFGVIIETRNPAITERGIKASTLKFSIQRLEALSHFC